MSTWSRNLLVHNDPRGLQIIEQIHQLYKDASGDKLAYFIMLMGNAGSVTSFPLLKEIINGTYDDRLKSRAVRALRLIDMPEAQHICQDLTASENKYIAKDDGKQKSQPMIPMVF